MRSAIFAVVVLTLANASSQQQPSVQTVTDFLPVSNGLWTIKIANKYIGQNAAIAEDTWDWRRCVDDGGKNAAALINYLPATGRDISIRVDTQEKGTEWVFVRDNKNDVDAKLVFSSPTKGSVTGKSKYGTGAYMEGPPLLWDLHMDLNFQGADCQGVRPGSTQVFWQNEWKY